MVPPGPPAQPARPLLGIWMLLCGDPPWALALLTRGQKLRPAALREACGLRVGLSLLGRSCGFCCAVETCGLGTQL